jgi:uncharacterized membrane protein
MKENKKFFANNNRLNKGHTKVTDSIKKFDNNYYNKKFDHVLPPIDLMEHYEEMYPGTLSKLIAMAEKEQAHKHKMNIKSIEVYEEVTKKGRISAIIFIMMVCLSVIILSLLGHVIIASVFSSSVFLGIGIGSFLSSMKFARKKDYIRKQN